jgi:hypothetical protein
MSKQTKIEPRTKKGHKPLWYVMDRIYLGSDKQTSIDSRKSGDRRRKAVPKFLDDSDEFTK